MWHPDAWVTSTHDNHGRETAQGSPHTKVCVARAGGTTGIDEGGGSRTVSDTVGVPLTELGSRTYLGFGGGLYERGRNSPPDDHAAVGAERATHIQARDANGGVTPNGRIVLLSIGMSNTSQEFCGVNVTVECVPGSFMQRAATSPPSTDRRWCW